MIPLDLSPQVRCWLGTWQWGEAQVEPVQGGTNNTAFRLSLRGEHRFLKIHTCDPHDSYDRFASEKSFYDLLADRKITRAPFIYGSHKEMRVMFLEWVHGKKVKNPVGERELSQALAFLVSIQGDPIGPNSPAKEAGFSLSDHQAIMKKKLEKIEENSHLSKAIQQFIREKLLPFWLETESKLGKTDYADFSSSRGRALMSPGDFGFHNALARSDGSIAFFDFEYAGWDDPAKTVADIFLQPEAPVSWQHWDTFCHLLQKEANLDPSFPSRANALLPMFAVKWACILIGSLGKRGGMEQEKNVPNQIRKAETMLQRVREKTEDSP